MNEQDELLLTDEEMNKVKFDMGSPWGLADRYTVGKAIAEAQLAKAKQHYEQKMLDCSYCRLLPDGAMLTMGTRMAHTDCVIQKLNELLDPDYNGVGKPVEVVGFLAKAKHDWKLRRR